MKIVGIVLFLFSVTVNAQDKMVCVLSSGAHAGVYEEPTYQVHDKAEFDVKKGGVATLVSKFDYKIQVIVNPYRGRLEIQATNSSENYVQGGNKFEGLDELEVRILDNDLKCGIVNQEYKSEPTSGPAEATCTFSTLNSNGSFVIRQKMPIRVYNGGALHRVFRHEGIEAYARIMSEPKESAKDTALISLQFNKSSLDGVNARGKLSAEYDHEKGKYLLYCTDNRLL